MYPSALLPQVPPNLVATPPFPPRVRGRYILQRRCLLPILRRSDQLIYTIHMTPTECIDPSRSPRQASADIWPRNRSDPTQFPQLPLARFNVAHRQGFLPACPQRWVRGEQLQVLRKVLLGPRRGEILRLGHFLSNVNEGPFLDLQFPKSVLVKAPRLQ